MECLFLMLWVFAYIVKIKDSILDQNKCFFTNIVSIQASHYNARLFNECSRWEGTLILHSLLRLSQELFIQSSGPLPLPTIGGHRWPLVTIVGHYRPLAGKYSEVAILKNLSSQSASGYNEHVFSLQWPSLVLCVTLTLLTYLFGNTEELLLSTDFEVNNRIIVK